MKIRTAIGMLLLLFSFGCFAKNEKFFQNILTFRHNNGIYLYEMPDSKNKKVQHKKLALVEGVFEGYSFEQNADDISFTTTSRVDDTLTRYFYRLNTDTLKLRLLKKEVYSKIDDSYSRTQVELITINEKGEPEHTEAIATDLPLYTFMYGAYNSEQRNNSIHMPERYSHDNTTVENKQGSLYLVKEGGALEELYLHKGGYSLKFGGGCSNIAIDPSGSFILFSYRSKPLTWSGKSTLMRLDLASRQVSEVAEKGKYYSPSFSEDGKHVLFTDGKSQYIINLQTKKKTKIGKGEIGLWIKK